MTRTLTIDGITIGDHTPTWVIAEIGHNHQGSLETCMRMFAEAKAAGADAVKLQKRDNRSLYTKAGYEKPYENENSYGKTYGEHREALEFGADEYRALQAYARDLGVTFFSTAFDLPSLGFLEELDMPAYKVASGDLVNVPLIEAIARTGKPMIISTGGATMDAVRRAHDAATAISPNVALLQCTAGYPAAWEELDLRVIETYRNEFPETVIGFSSHDNGISMPVAAHMLGSRIVEKHFTLDRTMKGTDHKFSLEPQGLRKLVRDLRRLHVALGDGEKRVHETERAPIEKMAKKIVATRDLPAGHVLTEDDLTLKSPGDGLHGWQLPELIGRTLAQPVGEDEGLALEALEPAAAVR